MKGYEIMPLLKEDKLVITMIADSIDGYVELTRKYECGTAWPNLIDHFNQFLAGQGYIADYNQFVEQKQVTV